MVRKEKIDMYCGYIFIGKFLWKEEEKGEAPDEIWSFREMRALPQALKFRGGENMR